MVWHDASSQKNIRKAYYNGSSWADGQSGTIIASNGADASLSVTNPPGTTAKAIWRSAGSSPYTLTLGPDGGLGKSMAGENFVYNRRLVYYLDNEAALILQMSPAKIVTNESFNTLAFPHISDNDSLVTVQLMDQLNITNVALPSDADSIVFDFRLYSHHAGKLVHNPKLPLRCEFELSQAEEGMTPIIISFDSIASCGESNQSLRLAFPVQELRGSTVNVRPVVDNIALDKLPGALVHVYEAVQPGDELSRKYIAPDLKLTNNVPPHYQFVQNYPNPFNPETSISFALPQEGHVLIEVYNVLGQKVATLVDEYQLAGYHSARWEGRDSSGKKAPAGIYLCRMKAGGFVKTQKMTLLP